MRLLTWVLVSVGALFAVGVAIMIGVVYWASSVEAVQISEADFLPGGTYTQADRDALLEACQRSKNANVPNCCACIADNGAKLSRYSRLVLAAGLDGMHPTQMVAITKGLMQSGVPEEKIATAEKDWDQQSEAIKKACGLIQ